MPPEIGRAVRDPVFDSYDSVAGREESVAGLEDCGTRPPKSNRRAARELAGRGFCLRVKVSSVAVKVWSLAVQFSVCRCKNFSQTGRKIRLAEQICAGRSKRSLDPGEKFGRRIQIVSRRVRDAGSAADGREAPLGSGAIGFGAAFASFAGSRWEMRNCTLFDRKARLCEIDSTASPADPPRATSLLPPAA
jgi:hypothetical protein